MAVVASIAVPTGPTRVVDRLTNQCCDENKPAAVPGHSARPGTIFIHNGAPPGAGWQISTAAWAFV